MFTIWKYELEITDEQTINIPSVYKELTVQMQHKKPCLWAIVDPESEKRDITILCKGTGHKIDTINYTYLGAVQMLDGTLVFHFFKQGE